jgi:hypothetical protein
MPIKYCDICGAQFNARLSKVRTCSSKCRAELIAREKVAKNMVTKHCEVCGTEFSRTKSQPDAKTCSSGCARALSGASSRRRVQKRCKTCDTPYEVVASAAESSAYCSKACMYARNEAVSTRECEWCKKPFTTPPSQSHVRTCSPSCGYQVRHTYTKAKEWLACKTCGSTFAEHESVAPKRVYCSHKCKFTSPEYLDRLVIT